MNAMMEPTVLHDGDGAKSERADNLHKTRYIELFLAFKQPTTGKLVAACYNSMYSSTGIPASRDTAPQDMVAGLDFEQMKNEYALLGASLNGPKLLLPDWVELTRGVERNFNGIKACWVANSTAGATSRRANLTHPRPSTARVGSAGTRARRLCCLMTPQATPGS